MTGMTLALVCNGAMATNGMNMIGGSARASGLGGADVALAGDCPGCNPATIGSGTGSSLALGVSFLHPPVEMRNHPFGPNQVKSDDHIYTAPYFEYAHQLGDQSDWTLGISFRAQGGMGVDFNDSLTPFGNRDGFATNFRFARAMPTVAYRASDDLRIGAALVVGYAEMNSNLFPRTYSPGFDGIPGTADDFAGMHLKDATGVGYAGRIGLHYEVSDRLSLGFTYTSETDMDLDDGTLRLNFGFAQVGYDAEIPDFAWPQEAELGLSFAATPDLLLVADLHWIDWSATVGELAVLGSNPDLPVPITNPRAEFKMFWDDQWVFAVGAEYRVAPRHVVRLGYNYAESPVPDQYVSPLFPGIVEHHVTVGYSYLLDQLRLDLAFEHSFTHKQINNNPNPAENPFGPGTEVIANPGNVLHLGLTYRF